MELNDFNSLHTVYLQYIYILRAIHCGQLCQILWLFPWTCASATLNLCFVLVPYGMVHTNNDWWIVHKKSGVQHFFRKWHSSVLLHFTASLLPPPPLPSLYFPPLSSLSTLAMDTRTLLQMAKCSTRIMPFHKNSICLVCNTSHKALHLVCNIT